MTRAIQTILSSGARAADLCSLSIIAIAWALAALVCAAQGYLFAAAQHRSQDWWATLGYTAAIFSVWGLLTPLLLAAADRLLSTGLPRPAQLALGLSGYPLATALHVLLFVILFWPVYGGQAATPLAMAEPVLLANIDTSALAYAALLAVAVVRGHLRKRAETNSAADPLRTESEGLWIRTAGGVQLIRLAEIDWIAAAGDYAEVHTGGRSLLTDRSLTALAEQLPAQDFARIHRSTIVRLDRVRAVQRLGRGDAGILLHNGDTLRLSRRYRKGLAGRLPV